MQKVKSLGEKKGKKLTTKIYNVEHSLVITDPTANFTLSGLSGVERTEGRVFTDFGHM